MKKLTYFLVLMFSLVLISACDKNDDDPIVPKQTFEELYPDWANLTWVSTDGVDTTMYPDVYPRLNITIIKNSIIFQIIDYVVGVGVTTYNFDCDALEITPTTATFIGTRVRTLSILTPPDNTKIKVIYDKHTYVLQIN